MPKYKVVDVNNGYSLYVVQRVYKTIKYKVKTEDGVQEVEDDVYVKEIYVKKWFIRDSITSIEQYIGRNNKPAKTRCIVFDKYTGKHYPVAHAMDDVTELFNIRRKNIGYNGGNI